MNKKITDCPKFPQSTKEQTCTYNPVNNQQDDLSCSIQLDTILGTAPAPRTGLLSTDLGLTLTARSDSLMPSCVLVGILDLSYYCPAKLQLTFIPLLLQGHIGPVVTTLYVVLTAVTPLT